MVKKAVIIDEEPKNKVIREVNFDLMLLVTFFTGIILVVSTYAWFSSTLNVKVEFFNLVASNQTGLSISLDGVNYGSSVEISKETIVKDLNGIYPSHNNQWANDGLRPVSSNGNMNPNNPKFNMYASSRLGYKINDTVRKRFLNTKLVNETRRNTNNLYISFDLFLKNVSGSPKPDNLYLDNGTTVYLQDNRYKDADGIINSVRFGFLKMGSADLKSTTDVIQNLTCNNDCEMIIYEPNGNNHSGESIERAKTYGVTLRNGKYQPTYAIINEGRYLDLASGQPGSDVTFDPKHFALQKTIGNFNNPIFELPNAVTKIRVYIWVEGQDLDSLESMSKGSAIAIAINFIKDYAGYE